MGFSPGVSPGAPTGGFLVAHTGGPGKGPLGAGGPRGDPKKGPRMAMANEARKGGDRPEKGKRL